ncbi:tetratricopeptide repeat protein [Parvularcula sp. LCG005]|uniref:tetratricopeptide repeat protein n=1 Tax=Parvularcula sp. LCG005 TaxID=3078805 RepID=UPI0029426B0F|nr:tetratricopeptide repeat protein [Parvularcula sp. LCG005]WOI53318.1 tetratricopeptide repeat protein [Parvularcula sp. LCG005]
MFAKSLKHRLVGASLLVSVALLAGCESKEDKAIKFANSGLEYLDEGDVDSANLQFNNALFQDPTNVVALRGAANIAKEQENFGRQALMLQRLLAVVPQDIEANNEYGRLSLLAGEPERAQEHAQRVLDQDADNVTALSTVGAALVLENKLPEASEVLQRALAADPNNPELFNLLAARSVRDEDFEAALATINDGLTKVEDPEALLVVKLVLNERMGDSEGVLSTFGNLIDAAPENGTYRQRLADYQLLKFRRIDEARANYLAALPLLENKTEVVTRIVGIDRLENGDEAAEASLIKFVNQYPEDIDLQFALPAFYCQAQDFERCSTAFRDLANDKDLDTDQRLRALNGVADVAIVTQDIDTAEAIKDEILKEDPRNATALVTQGQIQLAREQPEDAILSLREALEGAPDNAEGLVYLALAYEASGQMRFADAQFARALDQVGYTKPIVDQYRAFLMRRGEISRSVDVLQRYLRANPNDTDAMVQAAEGAMAERNYADAEEAARRLLAVPQLEEQGRSILARSLVGQERYVDALPVANDLLEDSGDQGTYILRAGILQRLGRTQEVIDEIEGKIANGTAVGTDYSLMGDLLNSSGDNERARVIAEQGIEKFPETEQLWVLAYITEQRLGNTQAATKALRDGMSKANSTVQIRTLLSNELITTGKIDEAIDVLRSLQAEQNLSPLTANNLASLLLDKGGADEEALRIARRFEGTDNPFFADTLAWAHFKAGNTEEASRYSRTALRGLPENLDVLYHNGVIEKAAGNATAAQSSLSKAKSLFNPEQTQVTMKQIDDALAGL